MELSRFLRDHSRKIEGKQQLIIGAYAKALEVIPKLLADNCGFDSTDILNKLRQKHNAQPEEGRWFGVDIVNEGICDTMLSFVWEPALVKLNCITAATEAACLILSVDETVTNEQSEKPNNDPMALPSMRGRGGRGMPRGMMGRGVRAMRGRR